MFNSDVSKWNTGAVTTMSYSKCTLFPSLWPRRLPLWCVVEYTYDNSRFVGSQVSLVLFFSIQVFYDSGFTRTLCGGKWQSSPGGDNYLTSTGRLGCCSPGTFMAQPTLNPFVKATACETCPVGQYGSTVDDDITSCSACATSGNGANAATVTCTTGMDHNATTCNAGYGLVGSACGACAAGTYAVQGNSAACVAIITKADLATAYEAGSNCSLTDKLVGCDLTQLAEIARHYQTQGQC